MSDAASTHPLLAADDRAAASHPRHRLLVRLTHWIVASSVIALAVSGVAILLAHPRLYWGETGTVGAPSLVDLPLPFVLTGQTGWGRSLHFLAAWMCVLAGTLYAVWGVVTGHFGRDVLPSREDLSPRSMGATIAAHLRLDVAGIHAFTAYNPLQRLAYSVVVFALFPVMIWTGLAMSPAVTSVWPSIVRAVGGHQSARTIHFAAACAVLLFAVVHLVMVCISGFSARMRAMTIGGPAGHGSAP
jgi:thiosulfate reductase cytochrome b subunit